MQYTNLGRAGVRVSRLCLGTYNFYHVTPEDEALALLDKAEELGINFIDTADIYGRRKHIGAAESLIDSWLSKDKGRRARTFLTTKVYGTTGPDPNERGLSAYHIRHACEESLRRLQTDHIDLYQMHYLDADTPWDEIWQAMDNLIQQSKVLYAGSSNFAAYQVAIGQCSAEKKDLFGLVSDQSLYNLLERSVEFELFPALKELGLGFLPWSPLAGGLLAGALSKAKTGRRMLPHKQQGIKQHHAQLKRFEDFSAEMGEKPAHIALAWLLHNPAVTAPVIGPRSAA